MECPTCGNEVTPGEVFCGQCGTPASLPEYPSADRMNMSSPRSGPLHTRAYSASASFVPPPDTYQPRTFTPEQARSSHMPPAISSAPDSAPLGPANPYQQTGFYHDATEAMSPIQYPISRQLPGYQQHLSGKHSNQIILIVCITLVVVLLGAVGITTFALLNRLTAKQATALPTVAPTIVPTVVPTAVPTIAPTTIPTAAPDAGFAWCGANCTQYGFTTEFPLGWQGMPAPNSQGLQFTNPSIQNVYASFKTPGATGDAPPVVLMNDVQSTFGSQPDYAIPTLPPAANATIGGAAWYAIATSYNDNQNQLIHVEVYATVYQGKAYIIELQAPQTNDQFDSVKQQFFVNMLVKFQFLPTAQ